MAIRKVTQTDPKKSTGSKSVTPGNKPSYQTPPDVRSTYDKMRAENTKKALENSKKTPSAGPKNKGQKKLMMKTTKVK